MRPLVAIISWAHDYINAFQQAQSRHTNAHQHDIVSTSPRTWQKPIGGNFKMNVDAAIDIEGKKTSMGEVMAAISQPFNGSCTPATLEAKELSV